MKNIEKVTSSTTATGDHTYAFQWREGEGKKNDLVDVWLAANEWESISGHFFAAVILIPHTILRNR